MIILDDAMNLIGECKDGTEQIKKIVLDLKNFEHSGEDKLKIADINSTAPIRSNNIRHLTML